MLAWEWANAELQFSRRVRRWVQSVGGGGGGLSILSQTRHMCALQGQLHSQSWSPSVFAVSTVHSLDALFYKNLLVVSS